jgi:hypothetical protein
MKLTPYLMFFNGTCREAFDFYASALGGQLCALITYGEMPSAPGQPPLPEEAKSQIAHVNLLAGGASVPRRSTAATTPRSTSRSTASRKPSACSPPCPLAEVCRCRCRKPRGRIASACSRTVSASRGWSTA